MAEIAAFEQERRYCLERAWATVGQSGEHVRRVPELGPVREDSMRAVLWRLMVGSHSAAKAQRSHSEDGA